MLIFWEQDLGWTRSQLTGGITLAVLASAMLSPLAGKLIDAGKGPAMMSVSALLGGLVLLLLSQITTAAQYYILCIVMGAVFAGALYDPCFSLLTRVRGDQARSAITRVTLVAGFAGTLSFPLVHWSATHFGWRQSLWLMALIALIVATPLLYWSSSKLEKSGPSTDQEQESVKETSALGLYRTTNYWLLAISLATLALLHGVTLHHLLPLLHERSVEAGFAVLIVSLIGPMQVTGRLLLLMMEKFLSDHLLTLICFSGMALSSIMLMIAGDTRILLLVFVLLFGGSYGMVSIMRPVVTRMILGKQQFGAKYGAVAVPFQSASAIAPWLGAILWQVGGYSVAIISVTTTCLLGLVLYNVARFNPDTL